MAAVPDRRVGRSVDLVRAGWPGGTCGFGVVHPRPGIVPALRLDTAITLPVGVEAYGAYALGAWLSLATAHPARTFARSSAIGSLLLGMLGQVAYHVLSAAHVHRAPWPVVVAVSCMPVCHDRVRGRAHASAPLGRTRNGADGTRYGYTRT